MKKSFVLALMLIALLSIACKKDASKFQGQVRFVDSTGSYYPAAGAILTLHKNDTSKAVVLSETANAEGIYLIENVPEGIYVVQGKLVVNSVLTYVGVTDKLECLRKDFIAAPIDLIAN